MLATALPQALGEAAPQAEEFHAPTVWEFFPGELLFAGTPFALTRINFIAIAITAVIVIVFLLAFRRPKLVPSGLQNAAELFIDVIYKEVVESVMGEKGKKYAPLLISMFIMLLGFNLTGIIPAANIAVAAVIGIPLLFAIISWVVFNVEGVRKHGFFRYLKMNLFPPGVPLPIYLLITPIEFLSTFILRPVTLTIRLLANMMAGHLLLVLFFGATHFFLLYGQGFMKIFALPSYVMGLIFVLFELLVALLQAYIFTLLTAVYIDGAISDEH